MIAIFHNVPALKKRLDWGYYTAPQTAARDRTIPQPRGWVLGGSGSINGMLFVRGNRKNYDDWAAAGRNGWSFLDVLPSFKRLEDWEGGASELRGSGGLRYNSSVGYLDDHGHRREHERPVDDDRRALREPHAPRLAPSGSRCRRKGAGGSRPPPDRCYSRQRCHATAKESRAHP